MKNIKKSIVIVCLAALFFAFAAQLKAQFNTSETARKAGDRMSQGDLPGAVAVLDKAIAKGKDLFEAHQMPSSLRMMQRNLDGAIADLSAALEIKPNAASLYEQRAQLRLFRRDSEGALKDYDFAIANGMKTEKVYSGRATVKRDLRDFDGALADYQAAIAAQPYLARAHVGLASLLDQKGETDNAIVLLQDFLDRNESERNGKLPQGIIESFGEKVTIKREGKEPDGAQVVLQGQQFKTQINANTPEELERQTEKLEQKMNLASAFANLALMYKKKGNLDKALTNIEKSILINQNYAYAIGIRGQIRLINGEYKDAVRDLSVSLRDAPLAYATLADRGIAYLMIGNDVEAQKDFDKYLELAPEG